MHISYCHTPMRYAWDLKEDYLNDANLNHGLKGIVARKILDSLQSWDQKTAQNVTHFIANSHFVRKRIEKFYQKSATVIYPPVDTNKFTFSSKKEEFYLTSSRLVKAKKIDLIVSACTALARRVALIEERKRVFYKNCLSVKNHPSCCSDG